MKTKRPPSDGVLTESERKELDQLGLRSFVHEYANLRRSVLSEDFSSSKTAYSLTRAQLAAVIRAIGVSDKAFLASGGRNAYSYVAVHTLARELSHDLRSYGDQGEMIERMRREVVRPMLQGLASEIVANLIKTRKDIHSRVRGKEAGAVDESLRLFQEQLAAIIARTDSSTAEALKAALNLR